MYLNAKYIKSYYTKDIVGIDVENNGTVCTVPIDPRNTDYQNIMKLVEEGELTIQLAEDINNQNS